jgi:hypothetical protein
MAQSRYLLRLAELFLVGTAALLGCLLFECALRAYVYYTYAIETRYNVSTMDALEGSGCHIYNPGCIYGHLPPSSNIEYCIFDSDGNLGVRADVETNNIGWISHHDVALPKSYKEFRIVVIGDSLTACITNSLPWTDVVYDTLNRDQRLLEFLGVERVSVINLGTAGAGFQYMAIPLCLVAKRLAADFLVVNFITEDLERRHYLAESQGAGLPEELKEAFDYISLKSSSKSPPEIPAEFLQPVDRVDSNWKPFKPRCISFGNVDIPLICPQGSWDLSNPLCKFDGRWFVPKGTMLSRDSLNAIKREAATRLLWHKIVLSRSPITLQVMQGHFQTMGLKPILATGIQGRKLDDIKIALRSLHLMKSLHPKLILLRNPMFNDFQTPQKSSDRDEFKIAATHEGFTIIDMKSLLPINEGSQEIYSWYNLPGDSHWSDKGARIYGESAAQAIRSRILHRTEAGFAQESGY